MSITESNIELYISTQTLNEEDVRGKTVAVIDVLRASSTIVTALQNGAKGVIPVADMDMAGKISQSMDSPQYLLCGEKNGEKIEGYHLGNSPLEYTSDTIGDKTIILNTTNGTKAIKKSGFAEEIVIGCFLNISRIIDYLKETEHPIALVCAGWRGRLSFEDLLCGGQIIYELNGGQLPDKSSDAVKIAFECYQKYGDAIEESIQTSDHARRLKGKIDPQDIVHCCTLDAMNILPALNDGIISDFNGKEKEKITGKKRVVASSKT
ncbi:MAG TPA: 2-phosphosulfolactate phosphatase [Balneolaceae bacterium]|nr:2-phosphosulfolactate phosphatase [Balneolaceae bacterium]